MGAYECCDALRVWCKREGMAGSLANRVSIFIEQPQNGAAWGLTAAIAGAMRVAGRKNGGFAWIERSFAASAT